MKRGGLSARRHFHPPPGTCTSASSTPVWPSKSGMRWKGVLVHLYNLHLYKPGRSSMPAALPTGEETHAAGAVACPCNALVNPTGFTIPAMIPHPFIFRTAHLLPSSTRAWERLSSPGRNSALMTSAGAELRSWNVLHLYP